MAAMTSRIKLLGRMDVVEKRRPQDGRIKTKVSTGPNAGREVEIRLSTLPTAFGEKLVMRIFDPEVVVRSYAELGFTPEEAKVWEDLIHRPSGIVLVTGPTGSGKTTTLYSTLKQLATDEVNVSTVEDPIEMVDPALNQMQVQHGIDLGFADGLRALMRQDPDIIMVGEIRDKETADMAVQSALTGHLVFSTLHTNDAAASIARLLELGIPNYLVNATLIGVLAQRLVRTLCPHCKSAGDPVDPALWKELVAPWRSNVPEKIYRPVGCLECRRTGYMGRTGLIEMLVMTDAMRKLIAEGSDLVQLRGQAARDGLRSLRCLGSGEDRKGHHDVGRGAEGCTAVQQLTELRRQQRQAASTGPSRTDAGVRGSRVRQRAFAVSTLCTLPSLTAVRPAPRAGLCSTAQAGYEERVLRRLAR